MPATGLRSSGLHRLLDFLLPRPCVVCGRRLAPSEEYLCLGCKTTLPYTHFWDTPTENPMADVFYGISKADVRAAALFFYRPGEPETNIVKTIKYSGQPDMGRNLGRLIATMMQPSGFFEGVDGLVPVPLAWRRWLKRGYNQSLMLARGVSDVTGLPIYNKVLERTRNVQSQTSLSPEERRHNVEGIFRLSHPEQAEGRHLLIIDDVVTTGATVRACAEELVRAEGCRFGVLSLAFTHRFHRGI